MKNLNKEIRNIEGRTQSGLTAGALLIKARALPKTPIDTSNLRASAYVAAGTPLGESQVSTLSLQVSAAIKEQMVAAGHEYTGGDPPVFQALGDARHMPWAVVGYTASYAVYVHEMDRHYRSPGTSWKFLELAVFESVKDVLDIIKATAKTK